MKEALLGFALAMLLVISPVVAETTVDAFWQGSGNFEVHFVAGDDFSSDFWTGGSSTLGEFHGVDYDDNPYGYEVDTTEAWVKAEVTNGGYMEFLNQKTDSWSSMYGPAGQTSHSYIETDDKGEMAFHTWANYASLKDCEYSWGRTASGHHFEASGSNFVISHTLTDGAGDGSSVAIYGTGSAWMDLMNSETGWSGDKSSFKFGKGCGCYKDADLGAEGVGTFEQHAWADNELNIDISGITIPGDGTDNSAQYHLIVNYAGSFSYPDLALDGW